MYNTLSIEPIHCFSILYSTKEWPIALDMACHKALSVVACTFEFANVADEDYYILKRDTPLVGGLYSPFITVYYKGHQVQYKGTIGFSLPPTKENFLLLEAGQSISATVQISDVFTFSTDGIYNIRYNKPLKFVTSNQMTDAGYIQEVSELEVRASIYIYLEDTHLIIRPAFPKIPKPDYTVYVEDCSSANFVGGSDTERKENTDAHKKLCAGFKDAKGRVGNNEETIRWFGAYDATRASKIKTALEKCENGITSDAVTYDFKNGLDSCTKNGWIGWTHISSPTRTVYLCGPNGYDNVKEIYCSGSGVSKERVLAHEWSHNLGGARDIKYFPKDCKDLAKDKPADAIENADSYALFYCRGLE